MAIVFGSKEAAEVAAKDQELRNRIAMANYALPQLRASLAESLAILAKPPRGTDIAYVREHMEHTEARIQEIESMLSAYQPETAQ